MVVAILVSTSLLVTIQLLSIASLLFAVSPAFDALSFRVFQHKWLHTQSSTQ